MNLDIIVVNFPQKLRYVRLVREYTLEDLSQKSGLTPSIISRYESGLILPGFINLARLAFGLNVSIDYLVFKNFNDR